MKVTKVILSEGFWMFVWSVAVTILNVHLFQELFLCLLKHDTWGEFKTSFLIVFLVFWVAGELYRQFLNMKKHGCVDV